MDKILLKKAEGKESWLIDTFKVGDDYDFEYIKSGTLYRSNGYKTEEKAIEDFLLKIK